MTTLNIIVLAFNEDEGISDARFTKNLREIGSDSQLVHVIKSLNLNEFGIETKITVCLSESECNEVFTDETLLRNFPEIQILRIVGRTKGALATACLALDLVNLDENLLIVNGDQVLDVSISRIFSEFLASDSSAGVVTFKNTHPRWSYVIEEDGYVIEVAEKRPISDKAICGYFIFQKGSDFLFAAGQSFLKREPIKMKYFVAPILNELILSGKRVKAFDVDPTQYHSLSTKLDFDYYRNILKGPLT